MFVICSGIFLLVKRASYNIPKLPILKMDMIGGESIFSQIRKMDAKKLASSREQIISQLVSTVSSKEKETLRRVERIRKALESLVEMETIDPWKKVTDAVSGLRETVRAR